MRTSNPTNYIYLLLLMWFNILHFSILCYQINVQQSFSTTSWYLMIDIPFSNYQPLIGKKVCCYKCFKSLAYTHRENTKHLTNIKWQLHHPTNHTTNLPCISSMYLNTYVVTTLIRQTILLLCCADTLFVPWFILTHSKYELLHSLNLRKCLYSQILRKMPAI